MTNDEQEYVLGEDVTKAAEAKGRQGTVVLSVRLTVDELSAIEDVAERTGKNLSQVVREAVRNGIQQIARNSQPDVTVSVSGGMTISMGSHRLYTSNQSEIEHVDSSELAAV